MKKSDFHFDLPPELIAQQPLAERSASRLLVLDVDRKSLLDRQFVELPDLLRAGDLLVFNDTRVLPARLYGRKSTGGAVEILIERLTGRHDATAQLGVSKKPREGSAIELADGSLVRVLGAWCRPIPGFYLYVPSRAQMPAKIRALIDFLGEKRALLTLESAELTPSPFARTATPPKPRP